MASTRKLFFNYSFSFNLFRDSLATLSTVFLRLVLVLLIFVGSGGFLYSQNIIQGVEEQDYNALVDLYNNTNGAGWNNSTGWLNSSVPVNDWYGVTVTNNRVTDIFLQSNKLGGELSSSIGNMTALKSLRLGYNGIGGELPKTLANLLELKNLQLFFNKFSGELPPGFDKLFNLRYLYLMNNEFTGSIEAIGSLYLIQLRLQNNSFTGNIPSGIGNMADLQHLYLESNQLKGNIPESLGNLSELSSLMLSSNQLNGQLPASLGSLSNLKNLHLYYNQLEGPVPETFGQLTKLRNFAVSDNQLSGAIPEDMAGLPYLEIFDISNNQINGLPSTPFISSSIAEFDVSNNQLTFEDLVPHKEQANSNFVSEVPLIADTIVYLTEGETYLITAVDQAAGNSYAWYKDEEQLEVSEASYSITNFTTADTGNYRYEIRNADFPNVVQKSGLFQLKVDESIQLIQGVVAQDYQALVDLYNNTNGGGWTNRQGWLNDSVPVSDWYGVAVVNSRISQIQLAKNNLKGGIPETIGNLRNLIRLFLNENTLSGPLPDSIGKLTNLKALRLYSNQLSGKLPASLGDLRNLEDVWLYYNQFEGQIPETLGKLTNLRNLYLHGNNLSGELPDSLGNLTNVTNLWVHWNENIAGDFPTWITNWKKTNILSIGDTDIGGTIPDSIGNLSNLTGFYIQRSNIGGEIPESLLNCSKLSVIDIKYTKLTELPAFINQFQNLDSLIANHNSFEHLPDFSIHPKKESLRIYAHNNHLGFEDIVKNFTGPNQYPFDRYTYHSQTPKDSLVRYLLAVNEPILLTSRDTASHNLYQWQKKIGEGWENLVGATDSIYEVPLTDGEAAAFYRCQVTNEWVTDLTLYSPVYHLKVYQNDKVIGDVPGNITSGFCSIGKYYTPEKGVASGDNIPTEGGAGVSGIDIDEKDNKIYVGAGASDIWVLDRSTNSGTILGKNKPIEGDPFPGHIVGMYLDDESQVLYVGNWGNGLWTYDIKNNIGKRFGPGTVPENGGDTIRGQVLYDIVRVEEKLFLSYFQFSYYQGGLYIWDQAAKTGKLLNAANTGVGGKYEVQGDPMPGNKCTTSAYHVRNGKEYIYIGIENFGLWEYNVTDNVGRLLTSENTQPGGSQEVIGDPMVDHEMYNIHFVEDKLFTGFWRGTAVWIYDVGTNESTVLSYETTRPGGIHEVDGDHIPEYFELGGAFDIDYSRGTIYYNLERSPEDMPTEERSAIWEYELKTNKARLHTYLDEGENYGATGRFVVKKDEQNNKLYSTSWPTKAGGGLLEISYSDTPCTPIAADEDKDRNWEYRKTYDAAGNTIGESKQFFDEFGRPTQGQSKSFSKHQVLASQQLYDKLGNGVLGTMPAPTNNRAFNYKEGFVKNTSGQDYSYQDFDEEKLYSPEPVSNAEEGTLGWYYSQNNTEEERTATTQYPYSRSWTEKTADPKIAKSSGPGDQYRMGTGHEVEGERQKVAAGELNHYWSLRQHFINADEPRLHKNGYKYTSTGPDGQQSVSFTDAGGKTLATALLINGSYDYWSYTYYNDLGQVVASVAPEGVNTASSAYPAFVTLFKYDHLGRTIEASSSDAGTSFYVYSYDGNIRFSQNEEQRSSSPARFSYTNYDYQGRLIESGEYVMSGDSPYIFETHETATSNPKSIFRLVDKTGAAGALDAERCRNVTKMAYDLQASDFPADELHPAQQFTYGQLTKSENEQVKSWYSYDEQGRLNWMKQEITGLGIKTVDYTYDFIGNVLEVAYQKGQPDAFYHHYSYDRDQRLEAVYTSKDSQSKKLQARYEYYLHGPLKREVLGNMLQGIDYTYTIDGALKAINHFDPEKDPGKDGEENGIAPDVFGLTLEYHEQDYTGAGYDGGSFAAASYSNHFNGLPKAQNWRSPVDGGTPRSYAYQYDETNQLEGADWGDVSGTAGAYSFSPSATNQHQVQVKDYDKHGNIQGLHRKGDTGNTLANFSYEYIPNTNRLAKVNQGGEEVIGYQYNAIGQLTSQVEDTLSMYMEYDAYGMVTAVFTDAAKQSPMLRFAYDDKGMRLSKTTYDEAGQEVWKTWYVYDAAGTLLSLYEENLKEGIAPLQIEVPIYGASRIGQYKPLAETYLYEIKDHTGSVRAVIGDTEPQTYMATMEQEQAGEEEWNFVDFSARENLDGKDTRVVVPEWLNHTPVAQTGKSPEAVRLNAAQNVRQGPRKSLRVFPGDKVEAGVFAKYLRLNENSSLNADAVIAALAGAGGYTVSTDASGVTSVADDLGNLASFGGASSGEAGPPNASLSYQLFDLNYNLLDEGFIKVSAEAALDAENLRKAHEKLVLPTLHIEQPGYLNIELRHDLLDGQAEQAEVYFDDFEVIHTYSNVVVAYDYYPYGLPMENRKLEREQTRHNYQGEFAEKDKETGYHAFQLRFYDARIGRWVSPDPYGQFASPYVGMGNLGHISSDPDGGWSGAFSSPLTRTLVFAGVGAVAGGITGAAVSGTMEGALIGAGAGAGALGANAGAVGNFLGNNIGTIGSAASGALRGVRGLGDPTIYIDKQTYIKGFRSDVYKTMLKNKLIDNGFSSNLRVVDQGVWESVRAWWNNSPTATITLREFNSLEGDPMDAGGFAERGKPHSMTIYEGLSRRGHNNPRATPIWKYVNASVHEVGHALFEFDHDENGYTDDPNSIMDYRSNYLKVKNVNFNKSQQRTIKATTWGK